MTGNGILIDGIGPGVVGIGTPAAKQGTIGKLQEAVEQLQRAKKLNDQQQSQHAPGSPAWHLCESIDDRLHDALALLGD